MLVLGLWLMPTDAFCSQDIQSKIHLVRAEQAHIRQVRRALKHQLGRLGRDMRALDEELLKSRQDYRIAQQAWQASQGKVKQLQHKQQALQQHINDIQQRMQQEAMMAWQRNAREPSWLDVLLGTPVTEIPHRRAMMRFALEGQAQEKRAWDEALNDLQVVEASLQKEHQLLRALKEQKAASKKRAKQRWQAKHQKIQALKHDAAAQKKRAQALRVQEQSLLALLAGLGEQLRSQDKQAKQVSIRKHKRHLPWPLDGRITVHFGDRVAALHGHSQGVQILPRHLDAQGVQVRAMDAGQVRYADWFGGFGLMMVVDYGHGVLAVYAHNQALHKQAGEWVDAGDVLASAGSTGWVEHTRLYFEIRDRGRAVNPQHWCRTHK